MININISEEELLHKFNKELESYGCSHKTLDDISLLTFERPYNNQVYVRAYVDEIDRDICFYVINNN